MDRSSDAEWEQLYLAHAPAILRYLAKVVRSTDVAADLLQETFARAIADERQLRDKEAVRAWLFAIGTRLALKHLRRQRTWRLITLRGFQPEQRDASDPEGDHVRRALERIAPAQALVLLLHYDSGFSREEIGDMLRLTEEGVKSRIARGRRAFIAAYKGLER